MTNPRYFRCSEAQQACRSIASIHVKSACYAVAQTRWAKLRACLTQVEDGRLLAMPSQSEPAQDVVAFEWILNNLTAPCRQAETKTSKTAISNSCISFPPLSSLPSLGKYLVPNMRLPLSPFFPFALILVLFCSCPSGSSLFPVSNCRHG